MSEMWDLWTESLNDPPLTDDEKKSALYRAMEDNKDALEELAQAAQKAMSEIEIMELTAGYFAWKQSLTWYDKLWIWLKGTRLT